MSELGRHSYLESKQFKQFTTYFTVKERKESTYRQRNGNGSISGAKPCIDITPLLLPDRDLVRSGISSLIRRNGAFS